MEKENNKLPDCYKAVNKYFNDLYSNNSRLAQIELEAFCFGMLVNHSKDVGILYSALETMIKLVKKEFNLQTIEERKD